MNFNERLKQAMKIKGYTTEKLAAKSGVSKNTIYNWRHGKSEPSLFGVMCVAKALDVSLDWLAWG